MLPADLAIAGSDTYSILLKDIACVGAARCVVVGAKFVGAEAIASAVGKTLIAEDTGGGRKIVSSPIYTPKASG